jgi:hypothetical protein
MILEGSRQWPLFSVFSLVAHANQLPFLQSYVEILRPLVCHLYILEAQPQYMRVLCEIDTVTMPATRESCRTPVATYCVRRHHRSPLAHTVPAVSSPPHDEPDRQLSAQAAIGYPRLGQQHR